MNSILSFLTIFTASAYFYNDVLALISFLGSVVLFLAAFPNSPLQGFASLAEWNSAPLVFGTFFQICFILTGVGAEAKSMGVLVPMHPHLVSALFGSSTVLMAGRLWVRRRDGSTKGR